jgi:hypothetical protein
MARKEAGSLFYRNISIKRPLGALSARSAFPSRLSASSVQIRSLFFCRGWTRINADLKSPQERPSLDWPACTHAPTNTYTPCCTSQKGSSKASHAKRMVFG